VRQTIYGRLSSFDLAEAFQLSHAISTLHGLGVLETIRRPSTAAAVASAHGLNPALVCGLLEFAAARTSLVRKIGRRFTITESYSPASQFLLELYTCAYGRNAIDLAKVLRRPRLATAAVDRKRHAQAFRLAGSLPVDDTVAELIGKLHFNHVLDLGCGSGALLLKLAKQIPGFVGWGLELNPAMCKLARARIRSAGEKGIRIVQGDSRTVRQALSANFRSNVKTVTACQVANEMFGAGFSGAVSWLRGLRRVFPGRLLLVADYYGRLGRRVLGNQRETMRQTILHDYVQLISGQGVPPGNVKQWRAIYAKAGCRLATAVEDVRTTRFVHVVVLGRSPC